MNGDETELLIAAIEQICGDGSEPSRDGATEAFDDSAWGRLEQADFTSVSIPTDLGGAGGTLQQAAAITRAAGRLGLAAPLVETIWAAGWALAASDVPVPRGPLTATAMDASEISLQPTPGGWRLDGVLRRVPWATAVSRIVGLTPDDGRPKIVSLTPVLADVREGRNLAGEPRDDVFCRDVFLSESDVAVAGAGVTPTSLAQRAALGRVVAMSGAAERVLSLASTQAKEREQFGRPLARFQAVQQLLARLAAETASVLVAGQAAARTLEHGTPEEAAFAISAAKASASQSAGLIAALGHQVLGALGFTMEHALHRSTRRLWAWREEYGNERHHHLELGAHVLDTDAWDLIVGGSGVAASH